MCRSMVDTQSTAAEIRRGKKEGKKPQGKNIMVCRITQGDHNEQLECGPMPNVMVALPTTGGAGKLHTQERSLLLPIALLQSPAIAEDCYILVVLFLQSPAIAIAIARDCYILVVLFFIFYFFFRPPNFRRPWADFHETLPHDAVCAEIVYLL